MDKAQLLETLRCALINCDNILLLGPAGIEIVRAQIQDAIDQVEGKYEEG